MRRIALRQRSLVYEEAENEEYNFNCKPPRSWLLRIEAQALAAKWQTVAARRILEESLRAAEQIPGTEARENNVRAIKKMLESGQNPNP